jgi:hypothetical protein
MPSWSSTLRVRLVGYEASLQGDLKCLAELYGAIGGVSLVPDSLGDFAVVVPKEVQILWEASVPIALGTLIVEFRGHITRWDLIMKDITSVGHDIAITCEPVEGWGSLQVGCHVLDLDGHALSCCTVTLKSRAGHMLRMTSDIRGEFDMYHIDLSQDWSAQVDGFEVVGDGRVSVDRLVRDKCVNLVVNTRTQELKYVTVHIRWDSGVDSGGVRLLVNGGRNGRLDLGGERTVVVRRLKGDDELCCLEVEDLDGKGRSIYPEERLYVAWGHEVVLSIGQRRMGRLLIEVADEVGAAIKDYSVRLYRTPDGARSFSGGWAKPAFPGPHAEGAVTVPVVVGATYCLQVLPDKEFGESDVRTISIQTESGNVQKFVLAAPTRIIAKVVGADGRVPVGCPVWVVVASESWRPEVLPAKQMARQQYYSKGALERGYIMGEGRADENGECELVVSAVPNARYWLVAEDGKACSQWISVYPIWGGDLVQELGLVAGGWVDGVVRIQGSEGMLHNPVSVVARRIDGGRWGMDCLGVRGVVHPQSGRFVVEGLRAGLYDVCLIAKSAQGISGIVAPALGRVNVEMGKGSQLGVINWGREVGEFVRSVKLPAWEASARVSVACVAGFDMAGRIITTDTTLMSDLGGSLRVACREGLVYATQWRLSVSKSGVKIELSNQSCLVWEAGPSVGVLDLNAARIKVVISGPGELSLRSREAIGKIVVAAPWDGDVPWVGSDLVEWTWLGMNGRRGSGSWRGQGILRVED